MAPINLASLTSRLKKTLWRFSGLLVQQYSERVSLHRAHVTIPALVSGIPEIAHGSRAKPDCQRLGERVHDDRMRVTGGAAIGAPRVRGARQDEVVGPELVADEVVGVVPPVTEAEIDEVQEPVLLLVGQDQEVVGENLEELFLRTLVLEEDVDGRA